MEIYSLNDSFLPNKLIDPYISAIWTERYSSAGDFQLVVHADSEMATELSRGRFLAVRGSKEIMIVESRTIENGVLTATGSSFIKYFNERLAWFTNPDFDLAKEVYDRPDPAIDDIHDFSGPVPLTFTIPEASSEDYGGTTVILALMAMHGGGFPTLQHSSEVTSLPLDIPAGGGSDFKYNAEAWRIKSKEDRTLTFADVNNGANITGSVRVYVLRGLKTVLGANVNDSFMAGYTDPLPILNGQADGTWTDRRRWIAWMAYRRTDLGAGHTIPVAAAIDDATGKDKWTDDGESTTPADATYPGISTHIRSANILTPSIPGYRPGATFHPSVEWADPPLDTGQVNVFALERDDIQPIPLDKVTTPLYADYTDDSMEAGMFLAYIVNLLLISPVDFVYPFDRINLNWGADYIPGLNPGAIDMLGGRKKLTFPIGPIYDGIEQIATSQHLGIKVYLQAGRFSSPDLRFATYRGVDRTSNNPSTRLIRMSPELDSLLNSKEFVSLQNYKNVVYVTYKNKVTEHFAGDYPSYGLPRRVIRVDAPDVEVKPDKLDAFLTQVAWNALIQHTQTSAVDGQVSTVPGHKFMSDYYLGDIIELMGTDGIVVPAQVTEHIRSQDQSGETREFPTLNIIDTVVHNLNDTTRPDEIDFVYEWYGDPQFDVYPPWIHGE